MSDLISRSALIEAMEKQLKSKWIPTVECLPRDDRYVLLSFENFSLPVVGRYEEDKDGGGSFYAGDEDIPLVKQDMIVNAWRELPERYTSE